MTNRELQNSFEYKLNQYDSELMLTSDLIFHWLNEAQLDIVEDTYSNVDDSLSFEQIQEVTDMLSTLVTEVEIVPIAGTVKPDSYTAQLPADYLHTVGEEVSITFTDPKIPGVVTNRVGITQSTANTYTKQISDPYSEHVLHYEKAKPLRLFREGLVELITDGNYTINPYHLRYLKKPLTLALDGSDSELPEFMHTRISDLAIELYKKSVTESVYKENK